MTLTPDEAKLVERLQGAAQSIRNDATPSQVGLSADECEAAASALIRIADERKALEADRDAGRTVYLTLQQSMAALVKKLEAAESLAAQALRERDEAREALAQTERNRDMWKEQVAQQAKRLELFAMFMAFVNRWTWGNRLTEAEALSCIQYHPILTEWRKSLLSEQPDKERT